jgi:hypothetical protein
MKEKLPRSDVGLQDVIDYSLNDVGALGGAP